MVRGADLGSSLVQTTSLERLSDFCTTLLWIVKKSCCGGVHFFLCYRWSQCPVSVVWLNMTLSEVIIHYYYAFQEKVFIQKRHLQAETLVPFCYRALFSVLLFLALWGSAVLRKWQHDLSLFTVTPAPALLRPALKGSRLSEVINNTEPQ